MTINFQIFTNFFSLKDIFLQVFQCLIIGGENAGKDALKNAENLVVSDEQFQEFTERHKDIACLVIESNQSVALLIFFNRYP